MCRPRATSVALLAAVASCLVVLAGGALDTAVSQRPLRRVGLCILARVDSGSQGRVSDDRLEEVVRSTWGKDAKLVRVQGEAGVGPLWRDLLSGRRSGAVGRQAEVGAKHGAEDSAEAAVSAADCSWYLLVASLRTYISLPAVYALLSAAELASTEDRALLIPLTPVSGPSSHQSLILVSEAFVRICREADAPMACGKGSGHIFGSNYDSSGIDANAAEVDIFKMTYGTMGCADGEQITSVEQCREALESLGLPLGQEWIGAAADVPSFCSVREFVAGGGEHLHWNHAPTGGARRDLAPVCMRRAKRHTSLGPAAGMTLQRLVDLGGYGAFSQRPADSCVLAVLSVKGWVQLQHIHEAMETSDTPSSCAKDSATLVFHAMEMAASWNGSHAKSVQAQSAKPLVPVVVPEPSNVQTNKESSPEPSQRSPLCVFTLVDLPSSASRDEVASVAEMVEAARDTWATNETLFVLADDPPKELVQKIQGLDVRVSSLESVTGGTSVVAQNFRLWEHALAVMQASGSCEWALKVPLRSYVNVPALKDRLMCFNASMHWYLGITTAAYTAGAAPFLFASEKGATILSRGTFADVMSWSKLCRTTWSVADAPYGSDGFLGDYVFALCLEEQGNLTALNYADINASFITFDRPAQALSTFEEHPDTMKQCLLVVSVLADATAVRRVHERIVWSAWHKSIPCIGESQTGKFAISDLYGNQRPYYDERIRLALYYCKAPEMLAIEQELSAKLEGVDPRSGKGSLKVSTHDAVAPAARSKLCIFVPSSARQERFIKAAESAWKEWGTKDTFFVSPTRLSSLLDPQTLLLDLDVDTDYAHLPVRTFRLFEALGSSEWVHACDWYMKADADSYLNVPRIIERLKCFNPAELWYLGVPQVAHGGRGPSRRFAIGGAGYILSRALLPKAATWAPFCLLQLLQHTGGTGMEDVSLANCLWKWGYVGVANYLDYETEAITSEARLNSTRIAEVQTGDVDPQLCCALTVHSLAPAEVPVARANIQQACRQRPIPSCRPDASRLRRLREIVLAPDGSGPGAEAAAAAGDEFLVYGDREYEALLSCSDEASP
eukprot:TRINITY_DN24277_c0_g2_i3.p1 TRINITY_DN24277_c0_g2~~TRINITY_DN24277_c0_g2_i3.p1  ORF type:complete len:1070 (-),score=169.34 TRINITY_DN24277_c0_g2_i3:231-3440(-)